MTLHENPEVVVVQTGVANTASVLAGISRAGGRPRLSHLPEDLEKASHVVLPGVGAFGAAMEMLQENNLIDPLRKRIETNLPTLCVCLGLQLLCTGSEESAGVSGLGVIETRVRRFPDSVKVPQLGWNSVEAKGDLNYITPGYAYFANSYYLPSEIEGWKVAISSYGVPFAAAIERGRILGCQFHPELSGPWGISILRKWLSSR